MKIKNIQSKGLVFSAMILIVGLNCGKAQAQTTMTFADLPTNTPAGESFIKKGVLFSSFEGVPIVTRDSLITKKYGLCSLAKRQLMGRGVNTCVDTYIGFVSPKEKMLSNLASAIKIKFLAVGGVTAYWYNLNGELGTAKASPDANQDLSISVPNEVFGILLLPGDCAACNFMITSLSFTLSETTDPLCGRQVTDAELAFPRLLNEDYPEAIYRRLDEFRRPDGSLDIGLQYLKADKITFYDEFAIIVKLPATDLALPYKMFLAMRRKLDTAGLGAAAKTFKDIGEFSHFEPGRINNRADGLPIVGDIFHINIFGPDEGDVMITSLHEIPEVLPFGTRPSLTTFPAFVVSARLRAPALIRITARASTVTSAA